MKRRAGMGVSGLSLLRELRRGYGALSKRTDWHPFDLSMRMLDSWIIDCEHLMERLSGEFKEGQRQEEYDQADVVSCVALGVEALGGFPEARLRWRSGTHSAVVVVALGAGHLGTCV